MAIVSLSRSLTHPVSESVSPQSGSQSVKQWSVSQSVSQPVSQSVSHTLERLVASCFISFRLVLRKVAMTLKRNNSSNIAQIPIKLYIFQKLYVLGIQLNQNFSPIFTFVTSRGR